MMNVTLKLSKAGTYLALVLAVISLLVAPFANAQTAPVSTTSTQAMIQGIVKGAAGVSTNAVGSGVVATSNGTVLVQGSGLKIPVPTSVLADVSKARIAGAAKACLTPVGLALCGAAAAAALAELGSQYQRCDDPAVGYICKKTPATTAPDILVASFGNNLYYASPTDLPNGCTAEMTRRNAASTGTMARYQNARIGTNRNCLLDRYEWSSFYSEHRYTGVTDIPPSFRRTCEKALPTTFDKTLPSSGTAGNCTYPETVDPVPETAIEQTLQQKMDADFQANKRLYDALHADQRAAGASGLAWPETMNPVKEDTPVTQTNPEVATPEVEKKRSVTTRPDGSEDTEVQKEKQVVPPTSKPGTVAAPPALPITSVVTTTTITNNITNNTTTNVTTQPVSEAPEETPTEEAEGLCKLFPDILACKKLEEPEQEEIDKEDKDVNYELETVSWAGGAGCPAPISLGSIANQARSLDFAPFCDVASRVKPFILAGAAMLAMFIVYLSLGV